LSQRNVKNLEQSGERNLYADPAAAAQEATDKIAAARVWLLKEKPFFGVLARALAVSPSLETAAFRLTHDDRLLANPIVVLELRFPALCARVAHVTMHAALGAFVRRGQRSPLRWNVAHDLAVDPLLRAAGLHVGAALPEVTFAPGASAEEVYLLLDEDARPHDAWCDIADPPPPPDAPPAGTFTRQDDDEGGDDGDGEGQGGQDPNQPEPVDPDPEPSPVEARGRELQWKMRLAAALEEEIASGGKTFGEAPGWIDELVKATIEPPPSFGATLQRSISMLTRTDRSFLRPSRRLAALAGDEGAWPDVVAMPGRRIVHAGKLVSVVDTSASIDPEVVARFLGALVSVATAEGFDEIRLVQADAEVTSDEVVFAAELLFREVGVVGRGGTDFGPALRMLAADSRLQAERFTVVYLTDLEGRFPTYEEVTPLEVLWVVPGKPPRTPPFGRVLELPLPSQVR
jgi:predicted metal-dependent peptidase